MSSTAVREVGAVGVRQLVDEWYAALDRHAPFEEVLRFVTREGLLMRFPEGTAEGLDAFRGWYETVTHRFFDEVHEVRSVETRGDEVAVVVNWQTRMWNPPAARSVWLGFDAYQTWTVALEDGTPRIRTYVVDRLEAMPGSAEL
ncbi:nuclear transport factor 2 family protein [Streptomyces sp. NPDC047097]|uniref:nuclear transport factor 2 family protein n=1 Tax=Streptomyces sp. NPDC047097 TaxID=3155260 RepID=UPI0033E9439B